MKKLFFTLSLLVAFLSLQAQVNHPWQGKKVGYIGDSITDPNCLADVRKYWSFLQEWLDITPYVYGISGREWNDVPRQVEQLNKEHGQDVDAILVFLGTNDFNSGLPIGEWYEEKRRASVGGNRQAKGIGYPQASHTGILERYVQGKNQHRYPTHEATLSRQANHPAHPDTSCVRYLRQ